MALIASPLPEEEPLQPLLPGRMLCDLVNAIRPGLVPKVAQQAVLEAMSESRANARMRENIGLYVDACAELGVPQRELFITADLFDNKDFTSVVKNLHGLRASATTTCPSTGPRIGIRKKNRLVAGQGELVEMDSFATFRSGGIARIDRRAQERRDGLLGRDGSEVTTIADEKAAHARRRGRRRRRRGRRRRPRRRRRRSRRRQRRRRPRLRRPRGAAAERVAAEQAAAEKAEAERAGGAAVEQRPGDHGGRSCHATIHGRRRPPQTRAGRPETVSA